ncbi:MAG: hypothetical protein RLP44_16545 [Aggregatilineales bacterium]
MVLDRPKLLLKAKTNRRRYFRRALWLILALVAAFAAWIALDEAISRDVFDADVLRIGQWVAVIISALFFLRILINLYLWLRTKNETVAIFDRGFQWEKGKKKSKYSWSQLKEYRDTSGGIKFLHWYLFRRGGLNFLMRDGEKFRLTARHGDLNKLRADIEPIVADITGTTIGKALRNRKQVKLHSKLVMSAGGIVTGKEKLRWSEVDVQEKKRHVVIARISKDGKTKTVQKFRKQDVINLPGFLDIAESTIRNHQPDRFNIKTYRTS